MKKTKLLIFDLDDTIFETKSIAKEQVAPIFRDFKIAAKSFYPPVEIEMIIEDLWQYPFDFVSAKYQFDQLLNRQFSKAVNDQEYELEIQVFEDFELVKETKAKKVLVTTGFKKLQLAKIAALDIEQEFDEIYIDEINDRERKHKKGIFAEILESNKEEKQETIVIGDNPNSELKAGHELGLMTIQVAKLDQVKSRYSDHLIKDYNELVELIS